MTLTELRYVVAVAEERHFGRAAGRCFVSQPSLSAAIRNVEDELGVHLFERSKQGVLVTEIGAEIVAQARRTLDEAARVKTVARQGHDPLKGVLRLGIIHTIAPYLLPDLVMALRRLAPEMPLDIEENITANLDRMLNAGELDAVILALPYDAPGIEVRPSTTRSSASSRPPGTGWRARRRSRPRSSTPPSCCCCPSATACATRCSTPARSSPVRRRPGGKATRWRRCAAWSHRASASPCCRRPRSPGATRRRW